MTKVTKGEPVTAPAMDTYKPSLYLDLDGTNIKVLKGLELGQEVQILVSGTIRSLEQRKHMRYEGTKEREVESGHLCVEGYKVQIVEDEKDFAKVNGIDDED